MKQPPAIPDVPAPALLSFVKQVSSEPSWTAKRLSEVLNIKAADVPQITSTLEMLGYVEPVPGKKGHWKNTAAGNSVSGAKKPRFTRDSVIEALDALRKRAEEMNADSGAPFHVTQLVAFGDFLDDHDKVQPADVGVALTPPPKHLHEHVLLDLRAKSQMLNLQPFEEWMNKRSHRVLLKK